MKLTLRYLDIFERNVTFLAFVALVIVMFSDVAFREITGTGLHWSRQVGVYANLFVVMFGLGVASSEAAHLRPKFADNWLPESFEPILNRIQEGLMFLFCFVFSVIAFQVVTETFRDDVQSIVLRIAVWPFQMIIPAAFFLTSIRHLIYTINPNFRPGEGVDSGTE
ncbi:MAG: TRAP transporter small permease subunit [Gammaproteobacteria bacterium]|jgi:TRAP-type C4-dicarboxylate transport system permease small subunit|nr:hypothetical protein [Gammaproteobacteria bacterium]MBQ08306.1 hypothetical protein [Gammaproteobacteria bacterium]MDP6146173.1 TRAP transporter small permease subunit [Gammaproteobacteria bacterium]HJL80593.1 TRAP transporter small permease subunit [Gammaproteobacteria bacterium]HJM09051.1 TRAP transporter small permease subunit [Gammaproteobacteria bacterium]|tara:strand:+ start:22042 stop:22539 length:498 start_codon:yes stop_codon:yes gene_type:complete